MLGCVTWEEALAGGSDVGVTDIGEYLDSLNIATFLRFSKGMQDNTCAEFVCRAFETETEVRPVCMVSSGRGERGRGERERG
jgi:hypothetical protein